MDIKGTNNSSNLNKMASSTLPQIDKVTFKFRDSDENGVLSKDEVLSYLESNNIPAEDSNFFVKKTFDQAFELIFDKIDQKK